MAVEQVLRSRNVWTREERAILEAAVSEYRSFDARATILRRGASIEVATLLLEGFVSRHVDGRDGLRQLVAMQAPGDFVDLHGYPLKSLDHDVGSLTPVKLAVIPHWKLWQIQNENPDLARKLWFLTVVDAAIHRKWMFRLGRLKAVQRLAHFLCETNARLFAIGLSDGRRFALPLTQFDLADVCGLTSVHVNRVMRELRERGLCTMRAGSVEILDFAGLMRLGAFEPGYLYLNDDVVKRLSAGEKMELSEDG